MALFSRPTLESIMEPLTKILSSLEKERGKLVEDVETYQAVIDEAESLMHETEHNVNEFDKAIMRMRGYVYGNGLEKSE